MAGEAETEFEAVVSESGDLVISSESVRRLALVPGVRRLDLFGSAAQGGFDPAASDVDVLAEFAGGPGFDYFGTYFALKEGLEQILGRAVDVVSVTSIRNPYFREQVCAPGSRCRSA